MGGITQAQAVLIGGGVGAVVIAGFWLWGRAIERGWLDTWQVRRAARAGHVIEVPKRYQQPYGWTVRCRRCGWLLDPNWVGYPADHREAVRVGQAHLAVFGNGRIVSAKKGRR